MDKKHLSIQYCAKVKSFEQINEQFSKCKCYIQALGKNRNLSHFTKESVQEAIPSLFNIPVVGHIIADEDGNAYMGAHDVELEVKNGKLSLKSLCVPYGVVPYQEDITFEKVIEPDGKEHTYLVADVILWTGRYPELQDTMYADDFWFNQSMEIIANEYTPLKDDSNYMDITNFSFSALCLLGKADDPYSKENSTPCFPMASVIPYGMDMQTTSFMELMGQLKNELSLSFSSNQNTTKKGGEDVLFSKEIRDAILAEFNVTLEAVDFEITEDTTEEAFRAAVEAFASESNIPENADTTEAPESPEPDNGDDGQPAAEVVVETTATSFSATYNQKREALQNAFVNVWREDDEGNHTGIDYWLIDFDDEYVYVEKNTYTDGDHNREIGRLTYTCEDGESPVATLTSDFELMVMKWLTVAEATKLDESRTIFEELTEFKATRLAADHKTEVETILSEFADLSGNAEFATLLNEAINYEDTNNLRTLCYAIRGKNIAVKRQPDAPARQPLGSIQTTKLDQRYGSLFETFKKK